jgi:hypothetical protein
MEHEPILLMGTDKIIPRYAYHKSLKIQLPYKSEWQNEFSPNKMGGLVWYMDWSKTNVGTGARLYRWGLKKGHSFSLELPPQYSRQKYMRSRHA